MARRILITGATGAVGGALIAALSSHPREDVVVIAASRSPAKRERLAARGVETTHLDYDDPASIRTAVAGVNRLFLATGYTIDMLVHSKRVLDAAREAGVEHVVHLGAAGSDTQPYAHLVWHAYVERYIEALGFGYTHLQPKTFMRNVLAVVRPGSLALRQFFLDAPIPWIDTDDIAAVAAAALLEPESHRNVTYPLSAEVLPMGEVVATIAAVTGLPFTYDARDPEELLPVLLKLGMEPTYAASLARAIGDAAKGAIPGHAQVYDTVERVTGRPAVTWAQFASKHRERFQAAASEPRKKT